MDVDALLFGLILLPIHHGLDLSWLDLEGRSVEVGVLEVGRELLLLGFLFLLLRGMVLEGLQVVLDTNAVGEGRLRSSGLSWSEASDDQERRACSLARYKTNVNEIELGYLHMGTKPSSLRRFSTH